MHTDNDKTPQKNTRLDIGKTPIDETERHLRQSRYSSDDIKKDQYPWLDENDPSRHITDNKIFESTIDLSEACIAEMQGKALYRVLLKQRKAFSLGDEVGLCPGMEVRLELDNRIPFYIGTFPVGEKGVVMDVEMRRGCLLGILRKSSGSNFSPIMVTPRKMLGIPHIITDFRYLGSRSVRMNCGFLLGWGCCSNYGSFRVSINLSCGLEKCISYFEIIT